ncbi:MAG: PqiC family protein [Pseudomonadota bacterium]
MKKIIIATVLLSLLAGCKSSPQKKYYYLNTMPMEQKAPPPANENITTVIGIGPIEIADHLNRLQMIHSQTNNLLTVADNDYWAEPLDKGIARVIALNLIQHNNSRSFTTFPWRQDSKPQHSLRVQINSLTRANNEASIIATWELIDNTSKTNLQRRNFIRSIPVESGAKNLAQAYSKLLAELAGEMDDALRKVAN